jgi:phosphatidylglycerol---prolipoprotein diacylglyceryl transferase
MFVNNLNPVFFQLGPVQIRYYGLVYSIGFLVAYLLLRWQAKKGKIHNFDEEKADVFMLYLIIGAIVGARLIEFLVYEPSVLLRNPLEFFYIWHGGMSFHGGLIGSMLATWLFCKKNRVRFYQLADFLVAPAALFLVFGRVANFINGELVGTKTTASWCVVFPRTDSSCRHPSQLYEAGYSLLIFIGLTWMALLKKFREGTIFWSFFLMYGVFRFIENFWRDESRFLGLSTGQYLCLIMIPVAIYFLVAINSTRETAIEHSRHKNKRKTK